MKICVNCNRPCIIKTLIENKRGTGTTHGSMEDWQVIKHCCQSPQTDLKHKGIPALIRQGRFYLSHQQFTFAWRTGKLTF